MTVGEYYYRLLKHRIFTLGCAAVHVVLAIVFDNNIFLGFSAFFIGIWVGEASKDRLIVAQKNLIDSQKELLDTQTGLIDRFRSEVEPGSAMVSLPESERN